MFITMWTMYSNQMAKQAMLEQMCDTSSLWVYSTKFSVKLASKF